MRGLGRELAKAVLAQGDLVIGTTRTGISDLPLGSHRRHILPLELPSADDARKAVVMAHALHGWLDVIANNAGYGLLGAGEGADPVEVQVPIKNGHRNSLWPLGRRPNHHPGPSKLGL